MPFVRSLNIDARYLTHKKHRPTGSASNTIVCVTFQLVFSKGPELRDAVPAVGGRTLTTGDEKIAPIGTQCTPLVDSSECASHAEK